jgi:nitrogen fixation protein
LQEVRKAIEKYFVPLFSAESSVVVVASAAGLDQTIANQLTENGWSVEMAELPQMDNESGESDEDDENHTDVSMSEDDSMSVSSQ